MNNEINLEVNVLAIGYKYNSIAIICFSATKIQDHLFQKVITKLIIQASTTMSKPSRSTVQHLCQSILTIVALLIKTATTPIDSYVCRNIGLSTMNLVYCSKHIVRMHSQYLYGVQAWHSILLCLKITFNSGGLAYPCF